MGARCTEPAISRQRSRLAPKPCLVLLLLSAAAPVRADQPPAFGLNWLRLEGAETCLTAAALAARVESHFGHVMFGPVTEAKLFVDGHVRAGSAGGWDVVLGLSLPGGKRLGGERRLQLPASDSECSAIDDGVVFVVERLLEDLRLDRVRLDPELTAELDRIFAVAPPEAPQVVPAVMTAASEPEEKPAPGPLAEHEHRLDQGSEALPLSGSTTPTGEARVDLAAVSGVGLLPGISFGIAVHGTLDTRAIWPIELGAVFLPPRRFTTSAAVGPPSNVDIGAFSISAALCPVQAFGALALCAGGEFGFVTVHRDRHFDGESDSAHVVGSPIATAVLRVDLGSSTHLRLSSTLAATIPRHAYVFEASGVRSELFESSPVTARGDVGVGLQL